MWVKIFIPVFLFIVLGGIFLLSTEPSSAQQCVTNQVPRAVNGLISSQHQQGSNPLFGNSNGVCVNNLQAAIPTFQIPTFDQLKSLFYDQFYQFSGTYKNLPVNGSASESDITGWLNQTPNYTTNYVTGDVNVGGINSNGAGVAVVFVNGQMNITGNISNPNGGLVFIVRGDIKIYKNNVTQIDAVLISTGVICTAYESGVLPPCSSTKYTDALTTSQLVVNGNFIDLNQSSPPGGPIVFRRQLLDNRTPAEVVNQQPKYLVLLKNLFSQTLTITSQGTDFADQISTSGPNPTPLTVNCSINGVTPPSSVTTTQNTSLAYNANASGGSTTPTCSWSDPTVASQIPSGSCAGNVSFSTTGQKNGTVTATSGAQQQSSTCPTVTVNSAPPVTTLTSTPTNGVRQGNAVTVTWSVASGATAGDYVGYFTSGGLDSSPLGKFYTDNCSTSAPGGGTSPSGSCSYTLPSGIANHNFRLFVNNVDVIRSSNFIVNP